MSRQLKISEAAHAALQQRALDEQRTMGAVVDRLLGVGGVLASFPLAVGAGQTGRRVRVTATGSPTLCRRCKHEARKHAPHCYVMGCACRSVAA